MKMSSIKVLLLASSLTAAAPLPKLHSSLERYCDLILPAALPEKGALRLRFMGVSTLLLEDGDKAILIDGFFSRPDLDNLAIKDIRPDDIQIEKALGWAEVSRLDAVVVAHSHYDHAMDSAVIAKRFGALLVGSASTANIAPADELGRKVKIVGDGDTITLGRFRIEAIASHHGFPNLAPGKIETILRPPVHAYAYKEGVSLSYLIEHDGLRLLIHGTAGFEPGDMEGITADVVLMGIGGVGLRSNAAIEGYWQELVRGTQARLVIPIHWDKFLRPIDRPLKPMIGFNRSMKAITRRAVRDGREVRLMRPFVPVDIAAAVPPRGRKPLESPASRAPRQCSGR